MRQAFLTSVLLVFALISLAQGPWNNPLKMAWSTDGIAFSTPSVFQDSSGVPSVIRWRGDTLIAAFQWFRVPNPSPTWDRIAVKFSYDNGMNWTQPTPIVISGLPANYQRPFDPTLTVFVTDSIRIYFSSSAGMPPMGLDSTVNTYSARSGDGINYIFEPGPRVDEPSKQVIDPAVVFFNNVWHYLAPVGSPQQGAYHYVSPDGINFSQVSIIPSDNMHNWTGNFMVEGSSELRFYGHGQTIWFKATPNVGVWNGYTATNVVGGDPSVVKISNNNYLMIYVGQPYLAVTDNISEEGYLNIYPNPANKVVFLKVNKKALGNTYYLMDMMGRVVAKDVIRNESTTISLGNLQTGSYVIRMVGSNKGTVLVKE